MDAILNETLAIARTLPPPGVIHLPRSRLMEFVEAAASSGLPKTLDELEEMRQRCLRGEAKVWGIPVVFE